MITNALIRALLEEGSVFITGFGTFSVNKLTAQIKDEVIFPPQNMIEFNYSKDVEGFDFVDKLSKWEQIRIDEAQATISEWIDLLEKGLEHNKSIFFDDFGAFSKDETGQIVFQSVVNSLLNIENEGLEPVLLPSVYKADYSTKKNAPKFDKRIILVKKAKKRDRIFYALTIIIAIITLCVLFLKDKLPNYSQALFQKKNYNIEIKDTTTEDVAYIIKMGDEESVASVGTNYNNENEWQIKHSEIINPTITGAQSQDIYLPYQKEKYYVIAGSFVKEEDALRHIKQKKLEKYHAKLIVHPQSKRIRICIGVFDNEETAIGFALTIDKNYWVLK